ncbi:MULTISPECIES: hypothetical protein [Peribacillus]|uniref:hypothetical protein n=1 Tax=Peribacillus TaxID=2675229 RepID=UPI00203DAD61|nr:MULTISPECIES: hypothetical protein [Peribacillus]MCM3676267.1 hypothetical protein [Peribacillus simplex]MDQ0879345.1 chemotaxis response regulator CheB [Peribacillus sp. V2I11]
MNPDLITMDMTMPIMIMLDAEKNQEGISAVKVIMHGSAKNGCRGYRSRGLDFIFNPFDEGMVLDKKAV